MELLASDTFDQATFKAIFHALDHTSTPVIGPADPRLLVIPIPDAGGSTIGGLWAVSLFSWLQVEMLLVPEAMQGQGVGSLLMALAEATAVRRGCVGMKVDTFSFQAGPFYEKMGFSLFGVLDDCPPGHRRLFFQKRLQPK